MTACHRCVLTPAIVAALVLAACSSNSSTSANSTNDGSAASGVAPSPSATEAPVTTATTTPDAPVTTATPSSDAPSSDAPSLVPTRTCIAPTTTTPVQAEPADSIGQEWSITSFDGAVIRAHWFPLQGVADDATAPTILMGPGWGSAGDTDTALSGNPAFVGIADLRAAGFNVLTWDPRGFGVSTGTVEVDSAEYEGRDVQQLLDWVAIQPQAQRDGDRNPRVGMFGASYGGAIQLVAASIDCRIDAIVPVIAWHSLQTSLFKADTPKTGWANFLAAASAGRHIDATVVRANASSNANGTVDPADAQWFTDRGPGGAVANITAPTLIIQGTIDTLFTLDEAVSNLQGLQPGVPAAMLWFCGGHGACLTQPGDQSRTKNVALAWLRRYVAGDTSVDIGAAFEFVDQDGVSYTADAFPAPSGAMLSGSGSGTLDLVAEGGAGPAVVAPATPGLAPLVAPITPGRATNSVDVVVAAPERDAVIVGAPQLTLTYSGTVPAGSRPTRVFAQLVDDATDIVLGSQITPIEVVLDGAPHTVTVPLEMVAFTAHPTSTVTLQVVATTVGYATPRLGGSIDFTDIAIDLPVVDGVTPVTGRSTVVRSRPTARCGSARGTWPVVVQPPMHPWRLRRSAAAPPLPSCAGRPRTQRSPRPTSARPAAAACTTTQWRAARRSPFRWPPGTALRPRGGARAR